MMNIRRTLFRHKRIRKLFDSSFILRAWRERYLIYRLTEREIIGRYKGSLAGQLWAIIQPLLMLAVYTFIFSTVFKARWGGLEEGGSLAFACNLFLGLVVFNFFSECINRAPGLIVGNKSYVTRVVFPLEALIPIALLTALYHAVIGYLIIAVPVCIVVGYIPTTALLLPVIWLPLIFFTWAICLVIAAVGVFVRDISQVVGVIMNMAMFLTPIFWPISALPEGLRPIINKIPISWCIEQSRSLIMTGSVSFGGLKVCIILLLSIAFCQGCLVFFNRLKPSFADVM
jgi:lipopolysaccharide transport system permease protein